MHCMRAYALYTKDTGAISGVYNTYRLDSDRSLIMLIDSRRRASLSVRSVRCVRNSCIGIYVGIYR